MKCRTGITRACPNDAISGVVLLKRFRFSGGALDSYDLVVVVIYDPKLYHLVSRGVLSVGFVYTAQL